MLPSIAAKRSNGRVEGVSSLTQEASVSLLAHTTVSSPPHCGRRTRSVPMATQADDATQARGDRMAVCGEERPSERLSDPSNEGPFVADRRPRRSTVNDPLEPLPHEIRPSASPLICAVYWDSYHDDRFPTREISSFTRERNSLRIGEVFDWL